MKQGKTDIESSMQQQLRAMQDEIMRLHTQIQAMQLTLAFLTSNEREALNAND